VAAAEPSPRREAEAALLGAAVFVVYALGASRTIFVGDSGELVAAVHVLGIPHPTGYPLYVLLGKLWTLLVPLGSVAFRMSLFSAACGALAAALLYRLLRDDLGLRALAAAPAALAWAFAPSVWGEANIQRVYTLNAVFVALGTRAAVAWRRRRDGRALARVACWCGLGATNHTFMAVFAAAFALVAVAAEPRVLLRGRDLAGAAAAFVAGLLPYAYLPIRARMNPPLNWGRPGTLDALWGVVTRRDFWERRWIEGPADLVPIVRDWIGSFPVELGWAGAALALLGLVVARRRWVAWLAVAVMTANLGALALHGSRSDIFVWHRYYVPSYFMAAVLLGLGADALIARLPGVLRVAPLAVPAMLLATGWAAFDRSRYRLAEDFAEAVLESLPPGAHLIATDDNVLFVLIYLQMVEARRPDVNLVLQGVGHAELPPLRFDPVDDPLFFTHHPNWALPALEIVPLGVVLRAWRAGTPPPEPVVPRVRLAGEDDPRVPRDYLTQNLIGHFHYSLGTAFETRDWPRARREFEEAARASPGNDVLFYNLGLIYRRNGLYRDALAAFRRAHEINPRHIASKQAARASVKIALVADELGRAEAIERELAERLDGLPPESEAWHVRLATLLEERGEPLLARGHRLLAAERAAGRKPGPG